MSFQIRKKIQLVIILLLTLNCYSQLFEGFESTTFPPTGWSVQQNTTSTILQWRQTDPANLAGIEPVYAGTYAAFLDRQNSPSGSEIPKDWLVTPIFTVPANGQLKFQSRLGFNGNQGGVFKVLITTNVNGTLSDLGIYQNLIQWTEPTLNPTQLAYTEKIVNFPSNFIGQSVRIAFYMEGDETERWLIDNVLVASQCIDPASLGVSNKTISSAQLTWANPGGSSKWDIQIVPHPQGLGSSYTTITQNPYTATATTAGAPLQPGTSYKYYVRSVCNEAQGHFSNWVGPYTFQTAQLGEACDNPIVIPSALPYIEMEKSPIGYNLTPNGPGSDCGGESAGYLGNNFTIYSYTPATATSIDITVTAKRNQTGFFIYDDCSDIGVNCLAGVIDSATLTKKISDFPVTAGNTYYIVVASTAGSFPYDIIVNQHCSSAPEAAFIYEDGCSTTPFTVKANVTNMGGASSLIANIYQGSINTSTQTITGTGIVNLGSFGNSSNVKVVLQNAQNPNCYVLSPKMSTDLCPAINDECANAIVLTSDVSGKCVGSIGKLTGATPSAQLSYCTGSEDDDVWFSFVAASGRHEIHIKDVYGDNIDIDHAVYEGTCGNLSHIYCSNSNESVATDLVVGQTYWIRVFSKSALPSTANFSICTTAYPESCTDSNPESIVVQSLFVDLVNHLITNASTVTPGYTCPELTLLAPYISDANPQICGFSYTGTGISFSFSNHGGNPDVSLTDMVSGQFLYGVNFLNYTLPSSLANIVVRYGNFEIKSDNNKVQHINFCPPNSCTSSAPFGRIRVNSASNNTYCVFPGEQGVLTFQTSATNIQSYSWVVSNTSLGILATSHLPNPVIDFPEDSDVYTIRLVIRTTDGCVATYQTSISVESSCDLYCTETNAQSDTVKGLFLDLVNHLLGIYNGGGSITSLPYNCPQLAALTPYLSETTTGLYVYYDIPTATLKFSFANHGASNPDVIIKNNGPIYDIFSFYLQSPSSSSTIFTYYLNGTFVSNNKVRHINFCPAGTGGPDTTPTPYFCFLKGKIQINPGMSCVKLNTPTGFSFSSLATNITGYTWTFFATNGTTVLATKTESHPFMTYTTAGTYNVRVVVAFGNGCSKTFNYTVTVSATCTQCTESDPQAPFVKEAYIDLLNYMITVYTTGGSVQNQSTNPKLMALAPYINDNNPLIWNPSYNSTSKLLRFSFGNHGTGAYDVSITATALINDISLLNFTSVETDATLPVYYANGTSATHTVKHINFCPGSDCPVLYPSGGILLGSGMSCIVVGAPMDFLVLNTAGIASYEWTFYSAQGNAVLATSYEASPTMTYNAAGTYNVKLQVTDHNGCKSIMYKVITVAATCGNNTGNEGTWPNNPDGPPHENEDPGESGVVACTESNFQSHTVKILFIQLMNKLRLLNSSLPNGYTCPELEALKPYITDANPAIYNINYTNNVLSFSFSAGDGQPDVVFGNYASISDVNLFNFSDPDVLTTITIAYSNGTVNSTVNKIKHIRFCPVPEVCTSHVAFVIDESSSINPQEAGKIKAQLADFITQQMNSNMTISFIGMSDSDSNLRSDHVYGKVNAATKPMFDNWIASYKNGYYGEPGISPNSDFWASGLTHSLSYPLQPDIVIVITDGSQANSVQTLKTAVAQVNQVSHLYVLGIDEGFYVNQHGFVYDNSQDTGYPDVTTSLTKSLQYLLNLQPDTFPVENQDNLLLGNYFKVNDFNLLYDVNDINSPRYFSNRLYDANIGCGGNPLYLPACNDCQTFQPTPGETYWVSAWVKEERNIQLKTYTEGKLILIFEDGDSNEYGRVSLLGSGDIIDGWQRIAGQFIIPPDTKVLKVQLKNNDENIPVYFDDIRIHPIHGSMKSYVYDPETFRLMAEMDDNNFSTFYEYDKEGGLVRIKKETSEGIKTIQESRSGTKINTTP